MQALRRVVCALTIAGAAFVLAACGHGAHTVPGAGSTIAVRLVLPNAPASSAARRPAFIAPSVRSGTFAVNGGTPQVAQLVAGAPGCATTTSGVTCIVTVQAPLGPDTFAVALYDGANASGALLGTGSTTVTISGTNTTVGITIGGVVAAVRLTLANPVPAGGTPATLPLTVTALDADGNIILADPYATPIALSDSDTSGATQLSTATVTSPAQAVTVSFNGTPSLHVTFSAAVAGATVAVQSAVLTPKTASTYDWPTFGYDAQRTGYNPNETACCTSLPRTLWTRRLANKYLTAEPLFADNIYTTLVAGGAYVDLVFAADNHSDLYALNAADGSIVWQKSLAVERVACSDIPDEFFGITGTPLFDRSSNRLYVVDGVGLLWAFDPATGNLAAGWPAAGLRVVTDPALDHVYGALNLDAVHGIMPVPTASYCDNGTWHGSLRFVNVNTATVVSTFSFTSPPQWGSGIWGMGGTSLDPLTGDIVSASGNAEPNQVATYSDAITKWTTGTFAVAGTSSSANEVGDDDYGAIPSLFPAPGGKLCAGVEGKSGILTVFDSAAIGAGPTSVVQMGPASSTDFNSATPSYSPQTGKLYITTGLNGNASYRPGIYAFTVNAGCTVAAAPDWGVALIAGSNIFTPITLAAGAAYVAVGNTVYARDAAGGAALWSATTGSPQIYAGISVVDGMMFVAGWDGTITAFGATRN